MKRDAKFAAKLATISLIVGEMLHKTETVGGSHLEVEALKSVALDLCKRWGIVDVPGLPETYER